MVFHKIIQGLKGYRSYTVVTHPSLAHSSDGTFLRCRRPLAVEGILDTVDPHEPVLSCVRLLQVGQVKVLVANLNVSCAVKARWRVVVKLASRGLTSITQCLLCVQNVK